MTPSPFRRIADALTLSRLSHLRNPAEFYPAARRLSPRKFILHIGPTNSGKTFHALEALRKASSGFYCGPLRLLAYEVFEKLNSAGCATDLVTGQEVERKEGSRHKSCTIEMCEIDGGGLGVEEGVTSFLEGAASGKVVDVAVVDEIQLIGDLNRGWAWTRVVLGALAREIHLCGDESALPIVTKILADLGDSIEIRTYKRLSPLKVASNAVRGYEDLRQGDCVIAFGRKKLFDIKKCIEKTTNHKVGVLYGALPPAVRRDQARRFNQTNINLTSLKQKNGTFSSTQLTDILVATDAVGMGLNLSINRIVFSEVVKFDGKKRRQLTISEIKQIGGRAGRGRSSLGGIVTSLDPRDLSLIKSSLNGQPTPLVSRAGLMPTLEQFELFAAALAPQTLIEELAKEKMEKTHTLKREDNPNDNTFSSSKEADAVTSLHDVFDEDLDNALLSDNNVDVLTSERCYNTHMSTHSLSVSCFPSPSSSSLSSTSYGAISTISTGAIPKRFLHTVSDNNYIYQPHPNEIADWILSSQYIPFSFILRQFSKHSSIDDERFFISDMTEMIRVAQLLDDIRPVLPFRVFLSFVQAPVDTENALVVAAFKRYAHKLSNVGRVGVSLRLPSQPPQSVDDLASLESAHAVFELYLWLARKFSAEFTGVEEARRGAKITQELILDGLERLGRNKDRSKKVNRTKSVFFHK